MNHSGDVDKREVKREDRNNPSVDASGGSDVGIREHTLDVPCVDLYYQIPDTDEIEFERTERAKEAIDFELGLRETGLSLVKGNRPEAGVVSAVRVFSVALTEDITDRNMGSINGKGDSFRGSIIDRAQSWGSEDGVLEIILRLDLFRTELEGLEFAREDDEWSGDEGKVSDKNP